MTEELSNKPTTMSVIDKLESMNGEYPTPVVTPVATPQTMMVDINQLEMIKSYSYGAAVDQLQVSTPTLDRLQSGIQSAPQNGAIPIIDTIDKHAINQFIRHKSQLNELIASRRNFEKDDFEIVQYIQSMNNKLNQKLRANKYSLNAMSIVNQINQDIIKTYTNNITNEIEEYLPDQPSFFRAISSVFAIPPLKMGHAMSSVFGIPQLKMQRTNMNTKKLKKHPDHFYTDEVIKMCRTIFILLFTLIVFWLNKKSSGYRIISWIMVIIFTKFFVTFIYLYSSTTEMSAVNIITTRIKGFGHISFPFEIDYQPTQVIKSVSQLSSIRGSNVYMALYEMNTHIGMLLFCAIGFKWHELNQDNWSWNDNQHLSLLFGLTTAFGIFTLGVWELNAFSKMHVLMHYLGITGLTTIAFGILFQSDFSIVSILSCCIGILLWLLYFAVATFHYNDEYENDSKKVHFVSVVSITLETVAWMGLAFFITIYVYNLHSI